MSSSDDVVNSSSSSSSTLAIFLTEKAVEEANKTLRMDPGTYDERISLQAYQDCYVDCILCHLWKEGYHKFPTFFVRSFARRLVSKRDHFVRIEHILSAKHDPPVVEALLVAARVAYNETRDREDYEDRQKIVRATAEMARLSAVDDGYVRREKQFAKHFCWACLDDFLCTEKTNASDLFAPMQDCSCLDGAGVRFCSSKCYHLSQECFDGCPMYGTGWHAQDVERWIATAQVRRREQDAAQARRREESAARKARREEQQQQQQQQQQQAAAGSSRQQQAAAGSSRQQQAAAGSSSSSRSRRLGFSPLQRPLGGQSNPHRLYSLFKKRST